jgi:hypothetical protein
MIRLAVVLLTARPVQFEFKKAKRKFNSPFAPRRYPAVASSFSTITFESVCESETAH